MIFITLLCVFAAIAMFIVGKLTKLPKLKFFAIIPVTLGIFLNIIAGFHVIDSTEIGVVRRLGQISGTISAGPHIISPWFDSVRTYDLRVQVNESTFASYTKDAQPVTATVEYQYALDPAYVVDVATEYGSQEIFESKIGNLVEEKVKVVFANYGAMSLLENRASLSTQINSTIGSLEEMFHITFKSIIVKDIDFSDAFEKSVEAKMEAEQNALKAEQEKKQAIIEAERAREVAAIQAEAAIAEAQGEAEAMRIRKDALESMPDTYIQQMWVEKWDGKLPTFMSDASNIMINPSDF